MKKHNIEQQSEEWFELKKKYPFSASKAQAIATAGAGLETVIEESLIEIHSSAEKEHFSNEHTERGNELEVQARSIYEFENGKTVETVGFITNSKISKLGGVSPDGLVDDGLVEIKCLSDKTYFKKLLEFAKDNTFKIDTAHEWQMQMQMLFTGKGWCDYLLYNPNFKKNNLIQRVFADEKKQQKIIDGLKIAETSYKEKQKLLTNILN